MYKVISVRPKDLEARLNNLENEGWKVVSQSESQWHITHRKCCGYSNTHEFDAIVNVTLVK